MPLPVHAEDTTPPLANGLQTFRPTYILGFGGTGTRIAARVHQMAMANPALREHDNKLFAFAGIDTNDRDLDLDLVRDNIKEYFRFQMSRPYTSIRQYTAGNHVRLTDFQTWIDLNPIIMDHDLTAGAGQKRSLSRAAWYLGMNGNLRNGLSRFLSILSEYPHVQAAGKPQVYIVSSVSGGTGAGGSMLLGRYVKHYLTNFTGGAEIPVIGMLLMSDIFAASPNGRGQHEAILANGYAYLKELEAIYKRAAFMDSASAREAGLVDLDFGDGLEASAMPFDSTFLVSQGNTKLARFPESANFYLYEQMMAQALYARIFCRDVATGTYGAENNKIDSLLRNQANPANAATSRYSTLGSSVLLYAKQDAIDYMTTSILCKKMISDEWKTLDTNYEKQRADYLARQKAGETGLEQPRRHACFAEMIEAANSPTNSTRPKQLVSSIYRDVVPAADSTPRYKTFIEAVQEEIRRSLQEALARKIQEHPTAAGYLQQFRNDPFASLRDFIREQTGKHEYVEQMSIIRELENDYLDVVERILAQIVTSQQLMVEDAILKPEDTIHMDMWPKYRLGRYLNPEMSFFGLRYFASALLCDIERELSGIDSELDSLASRYDGIVGRDFDPRRKGIDDADAVAVILGNLNPLQARMQNSRIQRFITEFERYFNERMDTLREINELKIRKSVYTRLARVLGENSAEGGFLGLHYLATDQLIARSPKMLHNAEAS